MKGTMSDTKQPPYKYHLIYRLEAHPDGILPDDIPEGHGGCDAGIFMSLLFPPDGSYSFLVMPKDGRTGKDGKPGDLDIKEEFKAWHMWSLALAKKLPRGHGRQRVAQISFEMFLHLMDPNIDLEAWRGRHELGDPYEASGG